MDAAKLKELISGLQQQLDALSAAVEGAEDAPAGPEAPAEPTEEPVEAEEGAQTLEQGTAVEGMDDMKGMRPKKRPKWADMMGK